MRLSRLLLHALVVAFAAGVLVAGGPAAGDAVSDKAEKAAVAKGRTLYTKAWRPGAKTCAACHSRGPNRLDRTRLKAYPKYDKAMGKVVTAQQKLNQMIQTKAFGQPPALGSDDLNALEAFVSTLE